jgi:hypothetical protein
MTVFALSLPLKKYTGRFTQNATQTTTVVVSFCDINIKKIIAYF